MAIADYALTQGYTLAWDGTLTKNFSQQKGLALEPAGENQEEELHITQEIRQDMYQTFKSPDDHLMHITGIVRDQNGVKYYITKNSYGNTGAHNGYIYMSENYFKARGLSYMLHKNAIPKEIRKN